MNAPTPTTQTEQHQTTRLNIDFSHRLGDFDYIRTAYEPTSTLDLVDAVNAMTDRADAILSMLEYQFIGEPNGRANDGIIFHVIEAALKEIKDVRSIVNAFHNAARLEKQNQQA